jgi:hypothetical protein
MVPVIVRDSIDRNNLVGFPIFDTADLTVVRIIRCPESEARVTATVAASEKNNSNNKY